MPLRQSRLPWPPAAAGRPWHRSPAHRAAAAVLLLAGVAGAQAQTATGLVVTPTFSVIETITDNRDLSSHDRQADAITQVSPGLRISSRTGQLTGGLSLSVNALHYARASDRNAVTLQTALDSAFHYEALDRHFFVDAVATAGQQAVSAFGVQSPGTGVYANNSQVTTVTVAPGVRGRIGDFAVVEVRANASKTDTGATTLGDSEGYGLRVSVSGGGIIGWGLDASDQRSDYGAARTTTTQQVNASLSWTPRYDLRLSARTGRARSDAIADDPVWVQTSGWSASWQPTDRSDFAVQSDRAYFGRSHLVSLRHRMARSVWSYTDSKGVAGDANAQISVAPLSIYDLLFSICMRSQSDPTACDAQVRLALAQQGLDPTLAVRAGFLASGLTLQRSQTLAVSYSAQRQTYTLSAFRTSTRRLGDNTPVAGDLTLGVPVRQQGGVLSASHQLTPASSLVLTLTVQTTLDAGSQSGNELHMASLNWVGTLGTRTSFALALRTAEFDSALQPYRETAVTGSLNLSF